MKDLATELRSTFDVTKYQPDGHDWPRLIEMAREVATLFSPVLNAIRRRCVFGKEQHEHMMMDAESPTNIVDQPDVVVEENQRQARFVLEGLPLPVTHCDAFNPLHPGASTDDLVRAAARQVGRKLEQTVLFGWNGSKEDEQGLTLGGLVNHDAIRCWDTASSDKMVNLLRQHKWYGPHLAIAPRIEGEPREVGERWAERHAELTAIEGIDDAEMADGLSPSQLIIVQRTSDCCRIVVGIDVTVIWRDGKYKVLAIIVPHVRSDFDGNAGIAVRGF